MTDLNLERANAIIALTLEAARKGKCKPLAVAVVDAGGHLIALQREDGATFVRPDVAIAKAWGPAAIGVSTRAMVGKFEEKPQWNEMMSVMFGGRFLPNPGGVPIYTADGRLVGGAGLSGDDGGFSEPFLIEGVTGAGFRTKA